MQTSEWYFLHTIRICRKIRWIWNGRNSGARSRRTSKQLTQSNFVAGSWSLQNSSGSLNFLFVLRKVHIKAPDQSTLRVSTFLMLYKFIRHNLGLRVDLFLRETLFSCYACGWKTRGCTLAFGCTSNSQQLCYFGARSIADIELSQFRSNRNCTPKLFCFVRHEFGKKEGNFRMLCRRNPEIWFSLLIWWVLRTVTNWKNICTGEIHYWALRWARRSPHSLGNFLSLFFQYFTDIVPFSTALTSFASLDIRKYQQLLRGQSCSFVSTNFSFDINRLLIKMFVGILLNSNYFAKRRIIE